MGAQVVRRCPLLFAALLPALIATPARAADGEALQNPALKRLYLENPTLFRKYYPNVTSYLMKDTIHLEHDTRAFIVHEPLRTGEWQDPRETRGSGEYADPVPVRPTGMHRRTYERLCNEAEEAVLPYEDWIMKRLHGFLAKSGLVPQTESERPDEEQVMKGVQRALERPELLRRTKRGRGRGRTKNRRSPGPPRRRVE